MKVLVRVGETWVSTSEQEALWCNATLRCSCVQQEQLDPDCPHHGASKKRSWMMLKDVEEFTTLVKQGQSLFLPKVTEVPFVAQHYETSIREFVVVSVSPRILRFRLIGAETPTYQFQVSRFYFDSSQWRELQLSSEEAKRRLREMVQEKLTELQTERRSLENKIEGLGAIYKTLNEGGT